MSGVTWKQVARVLVNSWPSGPSYQGWGVGEADAAIAEMQAEVLTPLWAIVGLRASTSSRVPLAVEVRELAFRAMGTPLL